MTSWDSDRVDHRALKGPFVLFGLVVVIGEEVQGRVVAPLQPGAVRERDHGRRVRGRRRQSHRPERRKSVVRRPPDPARVATFRCPRPVQTPRRQYGRNGRRATRVHPSMPSDWPGDVECRRASSLRAVGRCDPSERRVKTPFLAPATWPAVRPGVASSRWTECSASLAGPARRREVGEMRPGTRPAGSTNRRGRPRRWWARSTVDQAAEAGRPGGGSGASPSAARSRRTAWGRSPRRGSAAGPRSDRTPAHQSRTRAFAVRVGVLSKKRRDKWKEELATQFDDRRCGTSGGRGPAVLCLVRDLEDPGLRPHGSSGRGRERRGRAFRSAFRAISVRSSPSNATKAGDGAEADACAAGMATRPCRRAASIHAFRRTFVATPTFAPTCL